jgi:hypothetical protein
MERSWRSVQRYRGNPDELTVSSLYLVKNGRGDLGGEQVFRVSPPEP